MDDNAPKENPSEDFNKLDLSQLQGFSFGTQWTQEKPSAPERGGERPRRDGGGFPDRRDRRAFRRPGGGEGGEGGGEGGDPARTGRREFGGERRPRVGGGGDFRGGPRREGGAPHGERGPRYGHGGPGYGGRGGPQDRGPYESPYYSVTFYPEDSSFNTLVQTIRKSCRTVELFEIARTVVAKNDRFVVVVAHRAPPESAAPAPAAEGTAPAAKAPRPVFHVAVPDGLPFESDEAAVTHVLSRHLDKFFDTAEVEIEPPKGNFQVINRCGVTGELLGPPNYHRYNQIIQQHYAAKVASRMVFEAFRSRIETVRDPEVVNQWLAKMRKATRYTWKLGAALTPPPAVAEPTAAPAEPAEAAAAPAVVVVPTFDALEDARLFLLTEARDKVVRTTETARFHGRLLETLPPGEILRAVEGALERQRRFPLDTANALRGRLRREHFTIFKKGSKGVSYVCAVKRKFRVPGQTFADSIGALIAFIEANPMVRASELARKFLGISSVAAPAPAARPGASPEGEPAATEAAAPAAEETAAAPRSEEGPSLEDRARLARLQGDLLWLVREGYVTEFIDGRLFAPPAMVEARKQEIESEDHDPENFPEAPPADKSAAAAAPADAEEGAPAPEIPATGEGTEIAAAEAVADAPAPAEETSPTAESPPVPSAAAEPAVPEKPAEVRPEPPPAPPA